MYGFQSHAANVGVLVSDVVSLADVGKAGKHLNQGAEIGRQHKCHALHEYEILLGDPRAVRWVETHGMPNPHNLGARHVDAGVDAHGHQIFIAQVSHNGGVHPARASGGTSGIVNSFVRISTHLGSEPHFTVGAYLAYGDKELAFQVSGVVAKYRSLVVESANRRSTAFFVTREV